MSRTDDAQDQSQSRKPQIEPDSRNDRHQPSNSDRPIDEFGNPFEYSQDEENDSHMEASIWDYEDSAEIPSFYIRHSRFPNTAKSRTYVYSCLKDHGIDRQSFSFNGLRELAMTSKRHSNESWKKMVLRLTQNAENYANWEYDQIQANLCELIDENNIIKQENQGLEADSQTLGAAVEEIRMLQERLSQTMELPLDMDGIPIAVGDEVRRTTDAGIVMEAKAIAEHDVVVGLPGSTPDSWELWRASSIRHATNDTLEDLMREYAAKLVELSLEVDTDDNIDLDALREQLDEFHKNYSKRLESLGD